MDGSCYYPRVGKSDWNTAKDFCTSQGGHLAVITSADEQADIVRQLNVSTPEPLWIGGQYNVDTGVGAWLNDETWDYTNFVSNPLGGDNCVNLAMFEFDPSRKWLAHPCDYLRGALCEKPVTF